VEAFVHRIDNLVVDFVEKFRGGKAKPARKSKAKPTRKSKAASK